MNVANLTISDFINIIFNDLGVRLDNRAVIMVLGTCIFLSFVQDGRIENRWDILLYQAHDMTMTEFGWVANSIRWNRLYPFFI